MLLEGRRHNKIAIEANLKRKKERKPSPRTTGSELAEKEMEKLQNHITCRPFLQILDS